eukprot:CAMPEP_0170623536 /NCGR_PEP_ID=MMETSP0224-20130122/29752_1 /TAXON_ID=285029 /ORGANISM="Togula jolla, Strain CCCM 725" /LENGTH=83 /DNA_ID=CAMNT_0010949999 /DNA_START=85 /DNA_END=336 /DNA_ORIENTATION=+
MLQKAAQDATAVPVTCHHCSHSHELFGDEAGLSARQRLNDLLNDVVCVRRQEGFAYLAMQLCSQLCGGLKIHSLKGMLHQAAA